MLHKNSYLQTSDPYCVVDSMVIHLSMFHYNAFSKSLRSYLPRPVYLYMLKFIITKIFDRVSKNWCLVKSSRNTATTFSAYIRGNH